MRRERAFRPILSIASLALAITTQGVDAQAELGAAAETECTNFTRLAPPSWSQARNLIAFSGDCDGTVGLYVLDPATSVLREIETGIPTAHDPTWSNSGAEIAFSAGPEGEPPDVFVLDVVSGRVERLTHNGAHGGVMSWSPGDQFLGIYGPTDEHWNIYRLSRDGTSKVQLNPNDGLEYFNLALAPVGRSYAYSGGGAIYLKREGEARVRLTPEGMPGYMPKWAPDGRSLVFDGNAGDGWELYRIRVDGTGLTRLTHGETRSSNASWSPDGARLAHQCIVGEVTTLCVLNLETGGSTVLIDPKGNGQGAPRGSPTR